MLSVFWYECTLFIWSQEYHICSTQKHTDLAHRDPSQALCGLDHAASKLPSSLLSAGRQSYVIWGCYLANNCKVVLRCLSKMLPLASGTVLIPLKDSQLRGLHSSKDLVRCIKGEAKRHSETLFQTSWDMPWINRPSFMLAHSHHVSSFSS